MVTLTTPFALLAIVALGTIIYLSGRVLRDPASAPTGKHEVAPPVHWSDDFQGRINQVTSLLQELKLPLPLPTPVSEAQGAGNLRWTHRRYDIELPKPANPEDLENLLAPLRQAPPDVSVHDVDDDSGKQVIIGIDGLLTHTLNLRWRQRPPRVAIIVDGLGDDMITARDLAALPAPVGFAVKPSRPFSGLVAERARLADREVLVDLPIDVESAREKVAARPTPEDGAQDALTQLLDTWLEAVPQATGAAGELTARYSQNRQHLQNMIEHLKQKNVFVVDRGPGSQSIACDLAQSLREPCIVENDRLDDNADEAALRKQLATVREQARLRGSVVVGALARPALIAALRAELPAFANEQVEVVSLSETMAPSALSRR